MLAHRPSPRGIEATADIRRSQPRFQGFADAFLGSEVFVEQVRGQLPQDRDLSEIPRAQRRPPAKPLRDYARLHPHRDDAIAAAYASGGYMLKQIGEYFGLHYAQVSRIVRRAMDAKYKT